VTNSERRISRVRAAVAAPGQARHDWSAVVDLYSELLTVQPSSTLAIGRCVAIANFLGPAAGLADLDEVIEVGGLERYPYAFGARAQMLSTLGRSGDATAAWSAAAARARTDAEREFFAARAVAAGELSDTDRVIGQ